MKDGDVVIVSLPQQIGSISAARLERLLTRLCDFLKPHRDVSKTPK